jgi:hypothetical protein
MQTLRVRSVDLAGNVSAEVTYELMVPTSGPRIELVGGVPERGGEVTLKFSPAPGVVGVHEYAYRLNGGEEQTVAADEDGVAFLWFIADDVNGPSVEVRSHSVNGFVSAPERWSYQFPVEAMPKAHRAAAPTGTR